MADQTGFHSPRGGVPSAPALRLDETYSEGVADDAGGGEDSLEDVARGEQDYLRERLRQELKREPTDEELDEWARRHTEGY